jgi:hypothetical protein
MEARYGPWTKWYSMRQQREHEYSHLFANTQSNEPLSTPQMSMNRGLKVFGEAGVEAVKKEMLQLHYRKVMAPKHGTKLTPSQKQEALAYFLMFLCGVVRSKVVDALLDENSEHTLHVQMP